MDILLSCECGKVQGMAKNISPDNGNRVICCCDDCQAFAKYLNKEDVVLDEFGGTDIYQTSQSQVTITEGASLLRCAKLKPKGLMRWYTDCCKTSVGNAINSGMPFFGIVHTFMKHSSDRDSELGPVLDYVQLQHAKGSPDYPRGADKFPLGITLRIIKKMLVWKIQGKNKPSAFFDTDGNAVVEPTIVKPLADATDN